MRYSKIATLVPASILIGGMLSSGIATPVGPALVMSGMTLSEEDKAEVKRALYAACIFSLLACLGFVLPMPIPAIVFPSTFLFAVVSCIKARKALRRGEPAPWLIPESAGKSWDDGIF